MSKLLPAVDPDGLLEYSVVYTDRAVNHMSALFQGVMNDISSALKRVYNAQATVVVPGSGTFGMEAVARQFAHGKRCMVLRNGWFSYRWSQIFEMGNIPADTQVLKARPIESGSQAGFAPAPIEEVIHAINEYKPDLFFAPHVETASGIMLPDNYLKQVGEAVKANGGLFVLDCIASGAMWVDMKASAVDVLISAPQKGWSASACCGLVMLSARALERIEQTTSSSFACDLRKWLQIMRAYEKGGHAYHATMPTDALVVLRDAIAQTEAEGLEKAKTRQYELGQGVRKLLSQCGYKSVAAPGFEAPGVVVSYTTNPDIHSSKAFTRIGLQTAAGVPLQCDEPSDFMTFRIGLFGLDKLQNVDRTVALLADALGQIAATSQAEKQH
jgi:aspartate aminotransferase-like enzyme